MRCALLLILFSIVAAPATDPSVMRADHLAKKWKRTKSLAAPVEKLRKGLGVETGEPAAAPQVLEVKVDADTATSNPNLRFASTLKSAVSLKAMK